MKKEKKQSVWCFRAFPAETKTPVGATGVRKQPVKAALFPPPFCEVVVTHPERATWLDRAALCGALLQLRDSAGLAYASPASPEAKACSAAPIRGSGVLDGIWIKLAAL